MTAREPLVSGARVFGHHGPRVSATISMIVLTVSGASYLGPRKSEYEGGLYISILCGNPDQKLAPCSQACMEPKTFAEYIMAAA